MTDTTTRPATTVALDIGGMTCASCAARITKRLNKLDGVDASVNYATEQATVTLPDGLTVDEVVAQVEAIGYTAKVPAAASARHRRRRSRPRPTTDPELTALRNRLIVAASPRDPRPADLDDQHAAVHELAVAHLHDGLAGRPVGGLPVPPGRLEEPPSRRRHHGHPHLRRDARRVQLERLRPVLGRGRASPA